MRISFKIFIDRYASPQDRCVAKIDIFGVLRAQSECRQIFRLRMTRQFNLPENTASIISRSLPSNHRRWEQKA